jgi:signal transduction histidine kinase
VVLSGTTIIDKYRASAIDTIEECDRLMHLINTTLNVTEAEASAGAGTGSVFRITLPV